MKARKTSSSPRVIVRNEQIRLLNHLKEHASLRDYALVALCLRTGLSNSEAISLNVGDVFKENTVVKTLKIRAEIARNGAARGLKLGEEIRETLRGYLQWKAEHQEPMTHDAPLFLTHRTKRRLSARDFQRVVERASIEALGHRLTPQDLRHTFGTALYQETGDLETVRLTLGLTSLKSTQVYRQVSFDEHGQTDSLPDVGKESDIKSPTHDIEEVSIEGTLLMLDDATPHVAVVVQAIRPSSDAEGEPTVVATTLSDEVGKYQLRNLKPERYQVRCYTLNGYVYYQEGKFLQVERGVALSNIDFRLPPFKKGMWKTINYLNGLAGNYVTAIHRDSDGTMWFGTDGGGVSRYDGKTFVTFTTADGLADNCVTAIHHTPDETLWFGTKDGVSRYDGKTFVTFTTQDGLADNRVTAICAAADGRMWFGTDCGVSVYDGNMFVTFTTQDGLADNRVTAICAAADGRMWFGTGGGVSRYDGKTFVTFTTQDGLAHNDVRSIYRHPNGTLWFGTFGGGVSRYDARGFVTFTRADGLVSNHIHAIYRTPDGRMWFGTFRGISVYSEQGLVTFTAQDGLAGNDINAIDNTPDGALWFGTYHGFSLYDGKRFVNFTTKDGLAHNWVFVIHRAPDGRMWFGTDGGASCYDPSLSPLTKGRGKGRLVNFTTADGLASNYVRSIYSGPDGSLWFGTDGSGVSRYDPPRSPLRPSVPPKKRTGEKELRIKADRAGSKGRFVTFTVQDGLAENHVHAIHRAPDGRMWFGTYGGVSRCDGKEFVTLTTEDGLASNVVHSIFGTPDGVLWFGTKSGVSRYDGKEFVNFTRSLATSATDGLAHHQVVAIHAAPDGVLWFGTEGGGVSCYDGTAWSSLDTRDGLASNAVWAIHQDADGSLWFATDAGITHYRRCPNSPSVHIVSVTNEKEHTDFTALPAFTIGTLVTIAYNSIDFKTHPEKRQYRHRIKEIDKEWHKPTKAETFNYVFEKPGTYTFEVQAIDRDLNYSQPATLSLTVQPDPKFVAMQMELNGLRREVIRKYHFENLIGESDTIQEVHALMEKAIDSGLTVLISGETGTGKELVAKAIHYNSPRKDKPLKEINCGAIAKDLVASTLFGHRKGAFTGAHEDKLGLFEDASGGTVLLDEIGEMPEDAQVHLLRVLQERKIQRVGETQLRDVDVRVIAITNRDLMDEVEAGRFREDLYFRVTVFPIHVPPLRERVDDIPLLAEHFLQSACHNQDKALDGFAPGVMEMLQSYAWPGNVRELEHEIYRAVALANEGSRIQTYHFSSRVTQGESLIQVVLSERLSYKQSLDRFAHRLVEDALRECNGNRTQAAKRLGMRRPNLVALIKRLGLEA